MGLIISLRLLKIRRIPTEYSDGNSFVANSDEIPTNSDKSDEIPVDFPTYLLSIGVQTEFPSKTIRNF